MVKISKEEKKEGKVERPFDLRSIIHPKLAIFLSSAPFMLLCPFILIGVLTGWPIESWLNNGKLDSYEEAFKSIPYPEDIIKYGDVYSEISALNKIQGECDLISARLVVSPRETEDVSAAMLKRYQTFVDTSSIEKPRPDGFDDLFNSTVKLFKVNPDEEVFNNDELNVKVKEAFEIDGFPQDQNVYVFYMIRLDAFESKDHRCENDDLETDSGNTDDSEEAPEESDAN